MTQKAFKFGPHLAPSGATGIGFFQDSPGNEFAAKVTTKSEGGAFTLIQTVDATMSRMGKTTGAVTVSTPGQVNDNNPDNPLGGDSYLFKSWHSAEIGPNTTTDVGLGVTDGFGRPVLSDNPFLVVSDPTAKYPGGDFWTGMTEDLKFKTYLVYAAPTGVWISLARFDWELKGTASYNGQGTEPLADYLSAANWTVNPFTSTATGVTMTEIPQWSDYFTKYIAIWASKM